MSFKSVLTGTPRIFGLTGCMDLPDVVFAPQTKVRYDHLFELSSRISTPIKILPGVTEPAEEFGTLVDEVLTSFDPQR